MLATASALTSYVTLSQSFGMATEIVVFIYLIDSIFYFINKKNEKI